MNEWMYDLYFSSNFNHFRFEVLLPSFISIFIIFMWILFAKWKKEPLLPLNLSSFFIFAFSFQGQYLWIFLLFILVRSFKKNMHANWFLYSVWRFSVRRNDDDCVSTSIYSIMHIRYHSVHMCVSVFLCRRKMNYKHSLDAFRSSSQWLLLLLWHKEICESSANGQKWIELNERESGCLISMVHKVCHDFGARNIMCPDEGRR